MNLLKPYVLLLAILLCGTAQLAAQSADDDKDGVPNNEDQCPLLKGTRETKGCPVEKKELTDEDKNLLVKNFLLILSDVKNGFKTIKTGETAWDVVTRQGQSRSAVLLFPSFTDKTSPTLLFAQYKGKPQHAYEESSPADINTVIRVLQPTLRSKGFTEVNTKGMGNGMAGRSFRSAEAVVQFASNPADEKVTITIGRFSYYYEKDVKPISTQKSKPPAVVAPDISSKRVEQKTGELTAEEKKIFLNNLTKVLDAAPGFSKLKTKNVVESNEGKNFTASVMLFPHRLYETGRYFVQEGHQMVYANQKENYFLEFTQANPEEFITVLDEGVRKKGFEELEPRYRSHHHFFRVYRLKDLVLIVDKITSNSPGTEIRIGRISYYNEKEAVVKQQPGATKTPPSAETGFCTELEKVMNECVNGFKNSTGSFVKKETPAEYFITTLPALGFEQRYVVKSINIDVVNGEFNRKVVVYFNGEKQYTSQSEALGYFNKVKSELRNCYSGTVDFSDESNQKIYELFTTYKGKNIRIALIYLNFFNTSVSLSVKVND